MTTGSGSNIAATGQRPRLRVGIAYPFFPHYRAPVNHELATNGRHDYTFIADRATAEPSIKAWAVPASVRFVQAKVWRIKSIYIQPGLIRAALSRSYDTLIIHSGVWWPTTWLAAIVARLAGKRVLSWGHGWTAPERGFRGWLRRVYYRLYHAHMTYGHYAKELFQQTGWPAEKIHVIYNSLDFAAQSREREATTPHELAALRQELFGASTRPTVLCVTRLIPVRRLDMLIEAAAILAQRGTPVQLLLVGDGPERPALETLARERNVPCRFFGPCYDETVLSRLIMLAHVMVAPGKVGLTAMHALAYGTPVVSHGNIDRQMPEWEAIVPGQTGSHFNDGDVNDLARAVGEWTSKPEKDPGVSAACVDIIRRFWNPAMQRRAIDRAVDGLPADDLFWMKERE